MISLLIYILIVILIFGVIIYAIRLFPIDEPFKSIAMLIILILFIIVILGIIGLIPGMALRPLSYMKEITQWHSFA